MNDSPQLSLNFINSCYLKQDILPNIKALMRMHSEGKLGGETMPEDARPRIIDVSSSDNFHFLTLPMALNYQRNSYKLWKSAAETYLDVTTRDIFVPSLVYEMSEDILREKLLKYKVGLQPNKHVNTWKRICSAITEIFEGDIRNLFTSSNYDVISIRNVIQGIEKRRFPYLSGHKIFNYWLHVIEVYTPIRLKNRHEISVAPDTHVIQGSLQLGLITGDIDEISQNRAVISDEWKKVLSNTGIAPIDVHTPLWLWSRKGFPKIELENQSS